MDTSRHNHGIVEFSPADMTVSVEAGMTLGALQNELAAHRQWLPIDPPGADALSIHDLLAFDRSGPRRFGYGTIREHLIGIKVRLADGRVIKSGGKVVKNVAGYDLAKLFIGAKGTLGTIVEATFKLRPLPDVEQIVSRRCAAPADAGALVRAVVDSPLVPVILDAARGASDNAIVVVLGLAGTGEEVDWQLGLARGLGFESAADLEYETAFWREAGPVHRLSVLPSRLMASVNELAGRPFVARAGNGTLYYRGAALPDAQPLPEKLMRGIKAAFDPAGAFPQYPLTP